MSQVLSVIRALETAHAAYQAAEGVAEAIAAIIGPADQAHLKRRIAELRAENDTARARRHELLIDAGGRL